MEVPLLSDINILEGVVASVTFPLLIYLTRFHYKLGLFWSSSISWFITWVFRKVSVNLFKFYRRYDDVPEKMITIRL